MSRMFILAFLAISLVAAEEPKESKPKEPKEVEVGRITDSDYNQIRANSAERQLLQLQFQQRLQALDQEVQDIRHRICTGYKLSEDACKIDTTNRTVQKTIPAPNASK